ncbi:hypothetical protein CcaverHIS002_0205870 [Cutaneotrichosporon cavernicola]|uniref:Mitochondrial outer membrane protein OM14 C-terminal domain-containing protein n=1 Tax=Cutaneotrichosporon cavernicola TaxID=279322 RepID=A0AA48IDT5_9TREE|nr:uncharacterized protein CcaverHIS019_0205830 [Cutaneotrichosporon cavernicola]BEI81427.1 hypothetical protein CcaverHIS002_0205870 [Cutaneotrichosporon cavernicola]BEI89221.1 hypothetical protein CcaverHIS019_0205830 [Cutaneotrichosporon cavernicola]BEI96996.1 hypothetical protein CcaverHIS631_0205850 [Cutaneotrichosporon cavernicola]BEJ04770.1 hypothetical protein CcaverHIS641_0205870 [Cutaneotrichosporon cavernicola]
MSYAEVAKDNIPPGQMPEPSQELRDGLPAVSDTATNLESDSKDDWDKTKAQAEKDWDETKDKLGDTVDEAGKKINRAADAAEKKARELKKRANAELDEAETAMAAAWAKTKDVVLRPGTLGGLMGVVNVGLLGGMGYWAYKNRNIPWDRRNVTAAVAGTLALFGVEGFLADSYLDTPDGQAEAERAKREGSRLYLQTKEVILRPNVAGGLVGILNIGVLGTVAYFAYRDWNKPWDHQVVAGVTAGLLALSGIEGYLGSQYVEKELPKH